MKKQRGMDGVYFRVKRDGRWKNVCFSDMTEEEMDEVLDGRTPEWLKDMCKILGYRLYDIGTALDIEEDEDDE